MHKCLMYNLLYQNLYLIKKTHCSHCLLYYVNIEPLKYTDNNNILLLFVLYNWYSMLCFIIGEKEGHTVKTSWETLTNTLSYHHVRTVYTSFSSLASCIFIFSLTSCHF